LARRGESGRAFECFGVRVAFGMVSSGNERSRPLAGRLLFFRLFLQFWLELLLLSPDLNPNLCLPNRKTVLKDNDENQE